MRNKYAALVLILLTMATVAARQSTKYGVTILDNKGADLAKARTYSWTVSQPSFDRTVDKQIIAAVDRELAARGLKKLASRPSDLVVTYGSLRRTDVDLKARPSATGALPQYPVGSLVVNVRDASNRVSLYRVRMDTPIDLDPAKINAEIDAAVAAMFQKYPAAPAAR